jgi:hypothetical protein
VPSCYALGWQPVPSQSVHGSVRSPVVGPGSGISMTGFYYSPGARRLSGDLVSQLQSSSTPALRQLTFPDRGLRLQRTKRIRPHVICNRIRRMVNGLVSASPYSTHINYPPLPLCFLRFPNSSSLICTFPPFVAWSTSLWGGIRTPRGRTHLNCTTTR